MLSYRHSFHAGNFADILKHIVLIECLQYFIKKEGAFEYIDTHAGAGQFDFRSKDAQKLQEHLGGIHKVAENPFPEIGAYLDLVNAFNPKGGLYVYPGSPMIAKKYLRPQDRAWLYELHPQDNVKLGKTIGPSKKIRVSCSDGLKGMLSLMPVTSRRGLVLVDPSYEIKTEYDQVARAVVEAYNKFTTGTYIIWYPVVDRHNVSILEKIFKKSGIRNIQRFELGVAADSVERGMTSSGVFVINPPWTLMENMRNLLPRLAGLLSESNERFYKCEVFSEE